MPLIIQWSGGEILLDESETLVIGRSEAVEITLNHQKVSRHHLLVCCEDSRWVLKDLGTPNGSFFGDGKFEELFVEKQVDINLGSSLGPRVSFTLMSRLGTVHPTKKASPSTKSTRGHHAGRILLSRRTRIGRDKTNDLAIEDLQVSKFHAEITTSDGQSHELVDLGSANGTFVNGGRVKRCALNPGDVLSFGGVSYSYTGSSLESESVGQGPSLVVEKVGVTVGGSQLLSDVSFELKPSSLTAVIGPSGAGKSTLLSVLTGDLAPSSGNVWFGGRDYLANFDELRSRLGFVPQNDLLHTNLSVRAALGFGADLKFPRDVSRAEKDQQIERVIGELGIQKRANLRIDKLSGGQRKRTSVALELLTEPLLLLLDEPTSGLDPGLDRQVMQLLRKLADEGRTVLVVTHSTANLDICDDVLVLAPGGEVSYFGSPLTVLTGLEASDWAEAFDNIGKSTSTTSKARIRQTHQREAQEIPRPAPRQSWGYQLMVLIRRYWAVIIADRPYLAFLLALPVALALVGGAVGDEFGLAEGGDEEFGLNPQARSVLLILILGASFMGTASSIQELVKERHLYLRERSTGLSPSAYFVSKVVVLASVVTLQSLFFTLIALAGRPMPESGLLLSSPALEISLVVTLLAIVGVLIGLLISNFAKSSEVALPALVLVTMLQVVLSGAVPLIHEFLLDVFGLLNPGYWAMNAMSATIDLNELMGYSATDEVVEWAPTFSNWTFSLGVLGLLVGLLIFALLILGSVRKSR